MGELLDKVLCLRCIHDLDVLVALDGVSAIGVLWVHLVLEQCSEESLLLTVEKVEYDLVWLVTAREIRKHFKEHLIVLLENLRLVDYV